MPGYADPSYLECLAEFGEPVWLPRSKTGVLLRNIHGTDSKDVCGPYPLISCPHWAALPQELPKAVPHAISFVGVVDPFQTPDQALLDAAFPDLLRPYKQHWIVDLSAPFDGPYSESHRRHVRKSNALLTLDQVEPCNEVLGEWCELYDELIARHRIAGLAAFSRRSFNLQFKLPDLRILRAQLQGQTVAMNLWLLDGARAYYHLGAANNQGYAASANYALFAKALGSLHLEGVREVLLGAGRALYEEPMDGLARFKAGWANQSATAYLGGRILDPVAYRALANPHFSAFFPAYRASSDSTNATATAA